MRSSCVPRSCRRRAAAAAGRTSVAISARASVPALGKRARATGRDPTARPVRARARCHAGPLACLRTCATDGALELRFRHARSAFDSQALRLVVELLLRSIASAAGRACRPSAAARRTGPCSRPARPIRRSATSAAATCALRRSASSPLGRRASASARAGRVPGSGLATRLVRASCPATRLGLLAPVAHQFLRYADGRRYGYADRSAGHDLLAG